MGQVSTSCFLAFLCSLQLELFLLQVVVRFYLKVFTTKKKKKWLNPQFISQFVTINTTAYVTE